MKVEPPEFVVLASLDNRKAAERVVASLGRAFRRIARKGDASALVLSGNADGSLELTQSRALTVGAITAALMRASVAWSVGLLGIVAMLKGTKAPVSAARVHEGHVGSDEHLAHEMLAQAGPDSALVLIRCKDEEIWEQVRTRTAHSAIKNWYGSLEEFLAALDPGSQHDWVRTALGQPSR
jgi:hypothetical protein